MILKVLAGGKGMWAYLIKHISPWSLPPLHEQGCRLRKQYPLNALTNNVDLAGGQNTQRHLIIKVPAVMFEQLAARHCSLLLSKLIVSSPIKLRVRERELYSENLCTNCISHFCGISTQFVMAHKVAVEVENYTT
jgi:hypothetical protein